MATSKKKTRNTLTTSPKIRTSASRTEAGRGKDETRGSKTSKTGVGSKISQQSKSRATANRSSGVSRDTSRDSELIGQGQRRNTGIQEKKSENSNRKNISKGSIPHENDRDIDYEGKGRPNVSSKSSVSHGYESEKSPVTRWGQGNADEGEYESQGHRQSANDKLSTVESRTSVSERDKSQSVKSNLQSSDKKRTGLGYDAEQMESGFGLKETRNTQTSQNRNFSVYSQDDKKQNKSSKGTNKR